MMARLRRPRGDRGLSLVEVLVTIGLMGFVGSLITGSMITVHRSLRSTQDETSGLGDVRPVAERLARDVRAARGVSTNPLSTATTLILWIDTDSDYQHDANENVTWSLSSIPGDPLHFQVTRTVQGSAGVVQARTLVSDLAFVYNTGAPTEATRLITVEMTYDARLKGGTRTRKVTFQTRLRNVA